MEHFMGLMQRQEQENKSVISHLVARCEQLEEIAQRLQGSDHKITDRSSPLNSNLTEKGLLETLRQRNSGFSRPVIPKDPTDPRPKTTPLLL